MGRGGSPYLEVLLKHVSLRRAGRRVLEDINWRVRPGERWAVTGPNGCGKTQLLKLVAGILWPTPTARTLRRYLWRGEPSESPYLVKDEIAYLGAERQDKYERYGWDMTAERIVGTGIHRTDIALDTLTAADRRRIRTLLGRLGVAHLASRSFLSLSYGERRVMLLARALISRPRLLLLDEALNGLDETNRGRVGGWLAKDKSRLPWVFATHRLEEVPKSATHALVLDGGRVAYAGPIDGAPLTRGPAGRAKRAPARSQPKGGRILVKLTRASVYLGERRVLHEISLAVREGELWLLHGRNGSGKTTLLRVLYGDHGVATGGRVERAGIGSGVPLELFRKRVGLVAPHLQAEQPRDLTATEVVHSGRHASIGLNEPPSAADARAARRALARFGLTGGERRPLRELSYGQARRALFARAFVNQPKLLLLDEPLSGIDAATRRALMARVLAAHARGTAVVVSGHTGREWPAFATHEIELVRGRCRYCGPVRRRRLAS